MPGGRVGEDIAAQDLLNGMVGSFGLAIRLRMVGRAVQQVSTNDETSVAKKWLINLGLRSEKMRLGLPRHGQHGAKTDLPPEGL